MRTRATATAVAAALAVALAGCGAGEQQVADVPQDEQNSELDIQSPRPDTDIQDTNELEGEDIQPDDESDGG